MEVVLARAEMAMAVFAATVGWRVMVAVGMGEGGVGRRMGVLECEQLGDVFEVLQHVKHATQGAALHHRVQAGLDGRHAQQDAERMQQLVVVLLLVV